ncbi:hypothetical protein AB0N20_36370, partial [Streptomyces griseoincarnatus]
MSKDIATRVTTGVQALALPGQREGWQAQHRGSLLTDAQTYDALDVLPREVGDAAGGWLALQRGVSAVVIVGV